MACGSAPMITSRIRLVRPTRVTCASIATSSPAPKPHSAAASSSATGHCPSTDPANAATPAASAVSSIRRRRKRYGTGWSANMVLSAPAEMPRPASRWPVSEPTASGSTMAAVLRTATMAGTSRLPVCNSECSRGCSRRFAAGVMCGGCPWRLLREGIGHSLQLREGGCAAQANGAGVGRARGFAFECRDRATCRDGHRHSVEAIT